MYRPGGTRVPPASRPSHCTNRRPPSRFCSKRFTSRPASVAMRTVTGRGSNTRNSEKPMVATSLIPSPFGVNRLGWISISRTKSSAPSALTTSPLPGVRDVTSPPPPNWNGSPTVAFRPASFKRVPWRKTSAANRRRTRRVWPTTLPCRFLGRLSYASAVSGSPRSSKAVSPVNEVALRKKRTGPLASGARLAKVCSSTSSRRSPSSPASFWK